MKAKLIVITLSTMLAMPAAAQSEVYVSDPPHTFAYFEVGHISLAWQRGRFNKTDAKIVIDRAAKTGSIEAVIDAASVDTGHVKRDEDLRSERFFDAAKFPTITFKSNNLHFKGDTLIGADGELTMMGVTKPVSLEVTFFRCGNHPVNKRVICGADARTAIYRSEFGMKRGAAGMNDEVYIYINIEAYKS